MRKKYLIFISSTYEDLKVERRELNRLITELGHIPVSMEPFDFNDPDDRQIMSKVIDECDYFVSLCAHKLGRSDDGLSRIEGEYQQALKRGIPVIALVIGENARWKTSRKESGEAILAALEEFKKTLRTHPQAEWNTALELRQKARDLLIREINLNPRTGWVSAQSIALPAVANELGRLSAENEELRRRISVDHVDMVARLREKTNYSLEILAQTRISLSFYYTSGSNWEHTIKCRYLRLFKLLVPELYIGKTTAELARFLGSVLNPDLERSIRKDYPTPSNTIKKIMADFHLLKLVHFAGNRDDELWRLTDYGKELYAAYRNRQFERIVRARKTVSPPPVS